MNDLMILAEGLSKEYRLGEIGSTTLRDELQRRRAARRGEEDPTRRIGARSYQPGERFPALDNVSFSVKKGERVGILGPNGAGKSTLLKLISRITAPSAGSVSLNGRVASLLEVGTGFHGELTGRENIYMNGAILGMSRKEIDAKLEDIIDFSECRRFIDTPLKRYSSGMYLRLAFAVASQLDAEILIMDEVLAVGDIAFQKKCLEKMRSLAEEGRTILYVSHHIDTLLALCDRGLVLSSGKLVFDGPIRDAVTCYRGENAGAGSSYYDLSDRPRTSRNPSDRLHLRDVAVLTPQPLRLRDRLALRVRWEGRPGAPETACFRVYLEGETGHRTVAVSGPVPTSEGPGSGALEIDTSVLAPGKYRLCLQLFTPDSALHDSVNAFSFEVLHDAKEAASPVWLSYWGDVLLPRMSFRKEE